MLKKISPNSIVSELLPTTLGCWQVKHDNQSLYHLSWMGWDTLEPCSLSEFSTHIKFAIDSYSVTGQINLDMFPIKLNVRPFQLRVLDQLCKIPCGQTRTYGEIANILNSSPRAIGQACRTNPIQLFIPCHRIVSKSGIGGYMGKQSNIEFKSHLLKHEASAVK